MTRKPAPCGQRIQPLFARSENVEKKTAKMIFDLFGLDLVRQQPTCLGLRRDRPEDGLLGAHPVREDPARSVKAGQGRDTQTTSLWRIVSGTPAEQHLQYASSGLRFRIMRDALTANGCAPSRSLVFNRRPWRRPSGQTRAKYGLRPRRLPSATLASSDSVDFVRRSSLNAPFCLDSTYSFASFFAASFSYT